MNKLLLAIFCDKFLRLLAFAIALQSLTWTLDDALLSITVVDRFYVNRPLEWFM